MVWLNAWYKPSKKPWVLIKIHSNNLTVDNKNFNHSLSSDIPLLESPFLNLCLEYLQQISYYVIKKAWIIKSNINI